MFIIIHHLTSPLMGDHLLFQFIYLWNHSPDAVQGHLGPISKTNPYLTVFLGPFFYFLCELHGIGPESDHQKQLLRSIEPHQFRRR
jgi:hypothetical protein